MEHWKAIKGFENYKVSDLGRVKRIKCQVIYSNGTIANYPEKLLFGEIVKGYLRITLSSKNKQKRFQVHRLVAMYFIPNPKNKKCVNHINGDRLNNAVSNLEWCTYSENEKHAYDVLNKVNSQRKLSDEAVKHIRAYAVKGIFPFNKVKGNISHFMAKYNVDRSTVLNVLNEKYYV